MKRALMSELLPTRQAATLQTALLDYLTYHVRPRGRRRAEHLAAFLEHDHEDLQGPYVRTRLPFAPRPTS